MNGILNVYKPAGMTSHDVVAILRRLTRMKRIGHTGTLDPMATGVLPVCFGKATKIVEFLSSEDKTYRCGMRLGLVSDTQDIWGQTVPVPAPLPDPEAVRQTLYAMVGEIHQKPPMYSAVKVGGKKLYELAREGIEIEREARIRWIRSLDVESVEVTEVQFTVTCSKGTYVRTICHDAGQALGCGAVMTALERTASGVFTLETAKTLESLEALGKDGIQTILSGLDTPFVHLPAVDVDQQTARLLMHGVKTDLTRFLPSSETTPGEQSPNFRIYWGQMFIGLGTFKGPEGKPVLEKLLTSGDDHADF